MAKARAFRFEGQVEILDYGRMVYWIIRLPKSLQKKAPFDAGQKQRMVGTIGGQDVSLAWLVNDGRHHCLVSKALARTAKITVGSRVEVAFDLDGDDVVRVPPELREALRQEPAWRRAWNALTPGKQRGLSHMVDKLKSPDARAQKAIDILRAVEEGNVPGPPPRRRA